MDELLMMDRIIDCNTELMIEKKCKGVELSC